MTSKLGYGEGTGVGAWVGAGVGCGEGAGEHPPKTSAQQRVCAVPASAASTQAALPDPSPFTTE